MKKTMLLVILIAGVLAAHATEPAPLIVTEPKAAAPAPGPTSFWDALLNFSFF